MFGKRIAVVRVISSVVCRTVARIFSGCAEPSFFRDVHDLQWTVGDQGSGDKSFQIAHFWFFYWLYIYKPYKPINGKFSMILSLPHANTVISMPMTLLYHFLLYISVRFNNFIPIPKIFSKVGCGDCYAHTASKRKK